MIKKMENTEMAARTTRMVRRMAKLGVEAMVVLPRVGFQGTTRVVSGRQLARPQVASTLPPPCLPWAPMGPDTSHSLHQIWQFSSEDDFCKINILQFSMPGMKGRGLPLFCWRSNLLHASQKKEFPK